MIGIINQSWTLWLNPRILVPPFNGQGPSAIRDIVDDFLRFQRDAYPAYSQLLKPLATRQVPRALFIACSDSRIVPELLTQREPGELLVIRNAGNIASGYGSQPSGVNVSVGHVVAVLGAGGIMACGHSDCGAMDAIASCTCFGQLPAVADQLYNAEAIQAINSAHEYTPEVAWLDVLVRHNVIAQLASLRTYLCVVRALKQGWLNLYGWAYNIESGRIDALDGASRRFVSLVEHPKACAVGGTPGRAVA